MKLRCIQTNRFAISSAIAKPRRGVKEVREVLPGDADHHRLVDGPGTGDALAAFDNRHVPDDSALAHDVEDEFLAVLGHLVDLHPPLEDQVDPLGRIPGGKNHLAGPEAPLAQQGHQPLQLLVGQHAEHPAELAEIPGDRSLKARRLLGSVRPTLTSFSFVTVTEAQPPEPEGASEGAPRAFADTKPREITRARSAARTVVQHPRSPTRTRSTAEGQAAVPRFEPSMSRVLEG
jgi:hypothetical protein